MINESFVQLLIRLDEHRYELCVRYRRRLRSSIVKVLVLKNTPQQGTRQPNANIVYVTLGDENMAGPAGLNPPPGHVRFDEPYGSK